MPGLYSVLSILALVSFLVSCAPKAIAQAEESKLQPDPAQPEEAVPSDLPEESQPADSAQAGTVSKQPPANCALTVPQDPPFIPPAPYSELGFEGDFWFGSTALWTALPLSGVWHGLPHNPEGYTQKVLWWREGYVWNEEPEPALTVTGERLDAPAPPLIVSRATNAYASDIGSAMLVGVDFPTLGCWRITGRYADAELSFVIWVAP